MRAVRLHGADDVRIESVPTPTPGPGEVTVAVHAALTGGTVRKLVRRGYHATLGNPPLTLGHEGTGVVSAVGEGVTTVEVGDRVVPANSAPGPDGLPGTWSVGAFAEQWLVPAPIVSLNLHRIPDGVSFRTASLSESLATVLKGHDMTPAREGEAAIVLGTGALGLLWIRVLSRKGAHVTAVSRTGQHDEAAFACGAVACLRADDLKSLLDDGKGQAPLVIEAVGNTDAWELALRTVAARGRVHFFGGPPKGTSIALDTQRMHYEELSLFASFHHTPRHFARALKWLAHEWVPVDSILGPTLALDDVPACVTQDAQPKCVVAPQAATSS